MYNYTCTSVSDFSSFLKAFTSQNQASNSISLCNALRNEGLSYLQNNDYAKVLRVIQKFP